MRNNPTKLRCAIYARVSSDKQDVENSLDRQLRACRSWAERNGHTILDDLFIDEAKSGASTLARPGFQRLLSALRSNSPPFDAVLLDDDSRLDRGGQMASIVEAFQARRVKLITVDSGRDLTDDNERLLVHVKSGLNEHYLHELARRTRNGIASKVLHGYHAGGKVYGYKLVQEWEPGLPPEQRRADNKLGTRIEIHHAEAQIVLRIFSEYVKGDGFAKIADRLNKSGIPSSRGKPTWDASSVRVVLMNAKYIGDWGWNRRMWRKVPEALLTEAEREQARRKGRHPRRPTLRPAEDRVEKVVEALRIIPDDLWRKVQGRFAGRTRIVKGGPGYQRTRQPVAGLLRCSCGGPIGVARNKSYGHEYVRLGCAWHRSRGEAVCTNSVWMRMETIAKPLLDFVRQELLDPERVAEAVRLVNRKIEDMARPSTLMAKRTALESQINGLEAEVGRLVDALAKGTAYDAISAALADKDARLKAARAELAALAKPSEAKPLPKLSSEDVTRRLAVLWDEIKALDGDRARLALGMFFDSITVRPLSGDWAKGWRLEMRTRPPVLIPRGAVVAQEDGCGGRI